MIPLPSRERIIVLYIDFEICKCFFNDCMQQKSQNHHTHADIQICLYRTKLDHNIQESCMYIGFWNNMIILFSLNDINYFSSSINTRQKTGSIISPSWLQLWRDVPTRHILDIIYLAYIVLLYVYFIYCNGFPSHFQPCFWDCTVMFGISITLFPGV